MQHDPAPATTEENSLAGSPSRSFQSPGTHTMKSSSNNGGGTSINIGQKAGGEDASSHHGQRLPSSRPGSGTASPVLDRSPSPSPPGPTPVPSHPTSPSQEDHGQAEQNGMWQPNKMLKTLHQNNTNNNNNMPITQVEADPSVRKARVSVRARSDAPTVSRRKNSSFIRKYLIMNLKGRIHYKGGGGGG